MARYASNTDVSSSRSREEIDKTLGRYGATGFMYGWTGNAARIAFEMRGRRVQFDLPLPDRNSPEFTQTPARKTRRSQAQIDAAYEQAVRQKWRALALVIKAKLEACESGITEFEREFLAHIVLPNGETVGDALVPQIAAAYQTGKMPKLLASSKG